MLKQGKLSNEELQKLILDRLPHKRDEVVLRPGIGEDCTALRLDGLCVCSTDPITAADALAGELAVKVSCNDLAAAGASPVAVMLTLLIPPHETLENVKTVIDGVVRACESANIDIAGGHTEVTAVVTKILLSCTVLGSPVTDKVFSASGAQVGDKLIMTKYAAIEGTAIICSDNKAQVSDQEKAEAKVLHDSISVIPEGIFAASHGAHAMHDATEGGILGAAYEMAQTSKLGICVFEDKIPVLELTRALGERLKINVLRLISSGSLLIAGSERLAEQLNGEGVKATVIGEFTEKGRVSIKNGVEEQLLPPNRDELYKVI